MNTNLVAFGDCLLGSKECARMVACGDAECQRHSLHHLKKQRHAERSRSVSVGYHLKERRHTELSEVSLCDHDLKEEVSLREGGVLSDPHCFFRHPY